MVNVAALNALPQVQQNTKAVAQLIIIESGNAHLTLLFNPETLRYSKEAKYSEAIVGGTGINDQNYLGSSGLSLDLPELLLDSHCADRTFDPMLSTIQSLLMPRDIAIAPSPVLFVWGSKRFGPAVVTSMNWGETLWINGLAAQARLSLSLKQIPSATPQTQTQAPSLDAATDLTDRQRVDAQKAAQEFLTASFDRLPVALKSTIGSQRFNYVVERTGEVIVENNIGEAVSKVGRWDGFSFSNLLKL